MKNRSTLFVLVFGLIAFFIVGCGSSGDEPSDSGLSFSTDSSGDSGGTPNQPAEPAGPTKEDFLDRDISDIIHHLERGKTDLVVIDYTDPYTLSQVKIHEATFPEKKSMQKLYDGFRENLAKDLLADLKACQSLEPEILRQEGGWYSAYFYDEDTMSAEVIFAIDSEVDKNWVMIELPLTLPWGTGGGPNSDWEQWREAILASDHNSSRPSYKDSFDPHLNPAAVITSCRFAFKGRQHDAAFLRRQSDDPELQAEAYRNYMKLLTPDAQRYEAALIVRKLLTHKSADNHREALITLLDAHGFDRTELSKVIFKPYNDIEFYMSLSKRFPDTTDWAGFVGDAVKLYFKIDKQPYIIKYTFSASPRAIDREGDTATFEVNWTSAFKWGNEDLDTRFYQIDGKWYVESYWQAYARENSAEANE
jgi:hypothetical protein